VPISPTDRRVLGVLVEKAKTTPEAYPMSANAVTTGCNQKSNRSPLMQIEPDQAEESLDRLRQLGAVGLIEGYGRVRKYRHYLYEWLGVEKVELAVMAELLLRGDQTEGELRARASRMEPIADLNALRPVLESLKAKGLLISLTPEGRGHVVTHALYRANELERLKASYAAGRLAPGGPDEGDDSSQSATPTRAAVAIPGASVERGPLDREVQELRSQLAEVRGEVESLAAEFQRLQADFQRLRTELGG
jgi:uncharacterized protein YceH (UPF0502 family)